METIVSAVIGGIFSLLCVWLGHRLQNRPRARIEESPAAPGFERQQTPAPEIKKNISIPSVRKSSNFKRGLVVLLADFILMVFVVAAYDLNATEPWWENYFAFFAVGAIPVYALSLILSSAYHAARARFRRP